LAINTLFNTDSAINEQNILHDLVYDSIKIYGAEMQFLPRRINLHGMFGGDVDMATYDKAYSIEFYLRSVEGFNGDTNFLSFHGLEIRDRITITMALRSFENEVTRFEPDLTRPSEGDLVYFPLNKKSFQIKYVDDKPFFYQLGTLPMYDLQCELFEYSGELMSTGIPEIDSLQTKLSLDVWDEAIKTEDGFLLTDEEGSVLTYEDDVHHEDWLAIDDSDEIELVANSVLDFSEHDPFGEIE
jgi:hypothetical protein